MITVDTFVSAPNTDNHQSRGIKYFENFSDVIKYIEEEEFDKDNWHGWGIEIRINKEAD